MDWSSRRVLAWRTSDTLTTDFYVEALTDATARHGTPQIFNTDRGNPLTSGQFVPALKRAT